MEALALPKWKEIPPVPGMPHGTAWGLFPPPAGSPPGTKDCLGTLNFLTPSVVHEASSEIQTGKSVSLNWGMEKQHKPGFGRQHLEHKIVDWRKKGDGNGNWSYDDEICINTQAGSQWDGLRHWGHSKTGLYYGGIHHNDLLKTPHLGIENYTKRGGIVGRGILLDYYSYAQRHGIKYSPMSAHPITLVDLEAMTKEANLEIKVGDILLVRTGWTKWYDENSEEDRMKYVTNGSDWVGVLGCEETVEWLWNHHFAAVASDSIGFEVWPTLEDYKLHDHLLSMWGCPIGEMWDLEALADECEKQKRWSFFLTSSPINITGGVASPPNAIAIF